MECENVWICHSSPGSHYYQHYASNRSFMSPALQINCGTLLGNVCRSVTYLIINIWLRTSVAFAAILSTSCRLFYFRQHNYVCVRWVRNWIIKDFILQFFKLVSRSVLIVNVVLVKSPEFLQYVLSVFDPCFAETRPELGHFRRPPSFSAQMMRPVQTRHISPFTSWVNRPGINVHLL